MMKEKLRILIVDDDKRMTSTLVDILEAAGYEAVKAESGEKALELARTINFNCVVSDIRMPGIDGVELNREISQIQPGLPLVLMTAYAGEELIRRGKSEGVIGTLEKPLDIELLLSMLSSLKKTRSVTIVDDDATFCKTLGDILQKKGFSVSRITDPHAAISDIMENAQIILLDMKLNSITGLDILTQIRQDDPDIPVFLITGHRQEMESAIHKAIDLNVYSCLYKPLEIPELLQKLGELQASYMKPWIKE
jgi:two-component system, NtrC family, response regulator HydG